MDFYQKTFSDLEVSFKKNQPHVLWATLNNPDQRNAITTSMIDSLVEVLNFANFDRNIRAVVLTGKGKHFCAGGDIKAMEEKNGMFAGNSSELAARYQAGIQRIPQTIENLSVPIIALVQGAAIGAGCDLAMMCDLRVGTHTTQFGETFTRMGLVPGDGGTFFLQRVVGYAKAMEMFLTNKMLEGKRAQEYGLLNFYFDEDKIQDGIIQLLEDITSKSPVAQRLTKKAMKVSYLHDLQTSLEMLAAFQGISQRTSDHFEALKSFREKRSPHFLGE